MNDRNAIETALTKRQLWMLMRNGRWWQARRNGMTKTWVTRPGEFRIPIKCGLKSCGYITHDTSPENFHIGEKP